MAQTPDYHLLSTTRYDPQLSAISWNTDANANIPSPYLLLAYHRDRLLEAAQLHGWVVPTTNISLMTLEALCKDEMTKPGSALDGTKPSYRIRILLSRAAILSVSVSPIAPLPTPDPLAPSLWLPSILSPDAPSFGWELLLLSLDIVPTPPSLFTRTKTTHRDLYTAARNRFNLPSLPTTSPLDVVLYNDNDDITETSIRNIAFVRRDPPRWTTPAASTGCLPGVIRRRLLEQGRIVEAEEGELKRSGVVDGEYVLTFNGVEGCRLGRIVKPLSGSTE